MKYSFDLRNHDLSEFQFYPNAIAAVCLPERLDQRFSFLVWGGAIFRPGQHPGLAELLPRGMRSSSAIYHTAWGVITFHLPERGNVLVRPFAPSLTPGNWGPLYDQSGEDVYLHREWNGSGKSSEYELEFLLEQPWAYMRLTIAAAGPIHFAIDPSKCVLDPMAAEDQHTFDLYRVRQLKEIQSNFDLS